MLNLIEILEKPNSEILKGVEENGKRYIATVLAQYQKDFGSICASCPSKVEGYINKMKRKYLTEKIEVMAVDQKFVLKNGVVIPIHGTSMSYSQSNITDEIAIEILKGNPNAIGLFEKYPSDWKVKAISEQVSLTIEEIEVLSLATIRKIFPGISGKTKEQVLSAILEAHPELRKNVEVETIEPPLKEI